MNASYVATSGFLLFLGDDGRPEAVAVEPGPHDVADLPLEVLRQPDGRADGPRLPNLHEAPSCSQVSLKRKTDLGEFLRQDNF